MRVEWALPPANNVCHLRPVPCEDGVLRTREADEAAYLRYPAADRPHDDKPVLMSTANPEGWRPSDLLYQLHREFEARHRAATFASATTASHVLQAQSKLLAAIREAEIQQLMIDEALASSNTR